jgi:DNA-binding HxlR family transcriptional regulator
MVVIYNCKSEMQASATVPCVRTRSYSQFCGLAHALELVGERWALLVVRDLICSPKRFTDLRRGLPRIPSNILSTRLKELESAGIIRRRVLPRPESSVVYELTEYGRELEDIVLRLGLWGAKSLREPSPEDTTNSDSLMLGLRATFQPEAARGLEAAYELRFGDMVVHALVDDGGLEVGEGPPSEDADLVLETGPGLRSVMAGETSLDEAIDAGALRFDGDRELLDRFVEVFRIPPVQAAGAS